MKLFIMQPGSRSQARYGHVASASIMLLAGWLGATQVQAQTCGTYRFTTTQFAGASIVPARTSSTYLSAFGIPAGSGANSTGNVVNTSLTDAAQLGVLLSGSAELSTQVTSATLPAGATAGYVIQDGLLNLGIGQTIQITTYLNGTKQDQGLVGQLLDLPILGSGTTFVGLATTKPFNEIQVKMTVLIGAAVTLNVFYPMAVYDGTISGTNPTSVGGANGTASIALTTPASVTQVPLIYSWSNSGSTSTISGLTAGVYSGTISSAVGCLYTSSVTLIDPVASPGGVSTGLDFWFDPATSVTKSGTVVSAWADRSTSGNNPTVTQATTALQPGYSDGDVLSNFNPYINFSGNTRLNTAITGSAYARSHTTFGVVNNYVFKADYGHFIRLTNENNTDAGLHNWGLGHSNIQTDNVGLHYIKLPFSGGSGSAGTDGYNKINQNRSIEIGYPTLYSGLIDSSTPASTSVVVGQNGNEAGWVGTANLTALLPYDFMTIGGGNAYGMNNNKTSEIIHYARALTLSERQRVNTYLGIKYGLTLEHNYLSASGATIYNVTSYSADVTGIGRDDIGVLYQKQSKSVNASSLVTISNGSSIAAANALNTGTFTANGSFEIIGDNGLAATYATAYAQSFVSPAPYYAMSRVWQVQETGTVGTISVSIPGSTTGTYLLVRNDATFTTSSGTTEIAMTPDGNGNLTAQVDLTNGQFFTFAKGVFSPGCVATPQLWLKADASVTLNGSTVSVWNDNGASGATLIQNTAAKQPAYVLNGLNYNPVVDFVSSDVLTDVGGGTKVFPNATDPATIVAVSTNRNTTGTWKTILSFAGPFDYPSFHWFGANLDLYVDGYGDFQNTNSVAVGTPTIGYTRVSNNTARRFDIGYNGLTKQQSVTAATTFNYPAGRYLTNLLTVGAETDAGTDENLDGIIGEVITYNRILTDVELQRVQSYLALKYGITMTSNYLSGTGATIFNVSSYSANVTGIGRDDCQQLNQKQSKSVNSGAKLTVGLSTTIAATNATNPGSFTSDSAFLVFGDNGLTGTSSITAGGACPPPPSSDKWTNLVYKATETGNVPATFVQFDAGGLGFNSAYPVWMQVASDAAFTNVISSVPLSFSGSTASGTYDFPANSTVYVRFAGNTTSLANICVAPKMQTFHWNGWYYGDKTKTITSNYGFGNTLSNPIMKATVTDGTSDANVLLYKPTVNWWPVFDGLGLFIPRNDNNTSNQQNSIITTKMQFFAQSALGVASTSAVAAQGVDFILRDIDGWIGGKDVVKVYGKLGGATVIPKIGKNRNYPFWNSSSLTINNTTGVITGGWYPWDLTVLGNAYVTFDSPVEEVYVEYTKQNQYSFKVYNDLRIGAINVTCKQPTPRVALADNVYLYKQVSPNPEKVGEQATYKFTIQNTDCANKVINFNDVLPAGLTWVDSTVTTTLDWASVNNYGNGQTLSISSLTITPGTSYLYASVVGTSAGTFNNQASYVVTNGSGATLLSDDPGAAGTGMQPTALTLVANDPEANLVVTKSVDKTTSAQNGILTYTYTIANPNATAIATTFQDLLPGELTFVGSSLSGLAGGYTSSTAVTPYSGSAVLAMRNLSVPASSTLTFSVQANVNSYTIGQVATNVGQISPDILSGYRIRTYTTNAASTTITSNASFTFNCATASVAGSFTANGTGGQTGTLTIPILGATAGPASVSIVAGSGFVSSPSPFTLNLTAGQTSISVPVIFNGTGSPGVRTLTVVSLNATGTCSPTATITGSSTPPTIVILSPATNGTVAATPAPVISGTATPGATVVLSSTANANLCTTTADASGNWSCAVGVPSGLQTITATATNSGGSADAATTFTAVTPLAINSLPAPITATSGVPESGNAATALNPGGGTLPYVYTAFNPASGSATSSGTSSTPHGTVTVDPVTGAYTYTPTPGYSGTDAIGIKVCDSGTPQQCQSTIIPIHVAPQPGLGSIDCSKMLLTGVQAGTVSQGVLKLTINVTQTGLMPVTVSGSGLSLSQSPYSLNATTLGTQNFYVPVNYDGSAFGPMTVSIGGVGTCAPDLTGLTPKVVSQPALNLGDTCTPPSAATLVK